jgi:MIP family channel proteins
VYAGQLPGQGTLLPNVVIPFVALAHGFVLFILIQSLGGISGGHFNPAISLGLLAIRKISAPNAFAYVVVQLIGGVLAGFLAAAVLNDKSQFVKFAAPALTDGISPASGIVLEAIFTFLLVWTVVATAVNPTGPIEWAPLAIASALTLGVTLIGSLTGAGLNPARALGSDLSNALFGNRGGFGSVKDFLLVYTVGPVAGGVLAATIYNGLFLSPAKPVPVPPAPPEQSPL